MIERYVLGFEEIDKTQVALVGGKAMHLAELSRLEGIRVPAGFCVTTDAFRRVVAGAPFIRGQIDRCARASADDHEAVRRLNAEVRATLEAVEIPRDVASQVTLSLARLGEHSAYAVRSSATAEDLPAASFAGQQDTRMGIVGAPAILQCIRRCWSSLLTLDFACPENGATYLQTRRAHAFASLQEQSPFHGDPLRTPEASFVYDRKGGETSRDAVVILSVVLTPHSSA